MQHLHTNPKYQELRQRGYTHAQIAEMVQHCQQQAHLASPPAYATPAGPTRPPPAHRPAPSLFAPPPPPPQPQPLSYVSQPTHHTVTASATASAADASVGHQYHQAHEARRFEAAFAHPRAQAAAHVAPRAPVNLQERVDKSSMESVFQQAFQARQMDGGLSAEQHVPLLPDARSVPPPPRAAEMPPPVPPAHTQTHTQTHHTQSRSPAPRHASAASAAAAPNPHAQRYAAYKAELAKLADTEAEAYALLGVPKDYDLRTLAKAYKRAALKYHPDRLRKHAEHLTATQQAELNGMFEKVTKAYLLLMDRFERRQRDRSFDELRAGSRDALEAQRATADEAHRGPKLKLMKGDKFDVQLFNRIYNEHRLGDVYDDGHGDWLKAEIPSERQTETLFSGKFNQNVFNTTFEQLKRDDPDAQRQLVKREEPGALVLSSAASTFAQLGEDQVGDFGGASGSLEYSDLKEAHTTHATLIDAGQVHSGEGFDDIKALEAHRARLSHQRSEADIARDALRTREAELAEEARRARLARRDELGAAQQARLGGLLTYGA